MLEESSRNLSSIFKVICSEVGVRKLLKKDPKVSRDYLGIETDAQSLLRIIIMKVFRRDLQRIFVGMKDIPTRDVSAFTMVRNLIIGSLPRATSRKRNPRKDKNTVTSLPRKTQCNERDIARVKNCGT